MSHAVSSLPDIPALQRLTQSLAMLEAIVEPEWESRYYSFNSRWGQDKMMASMRNGSGDDWFLLFCPGGAIMKGFDLHSPMAKNAPWPGVLSEVPAAFESFLIEPAFSIPDTTYCTWREVEDREWRRGEIVFPPGSDPDGAKAQFAILDGDPETYRQWAAEYYEVDLPLDAVAHLYDYRPLTLEIAAQLNADVVWDDLAADLEEIGYPIDPASTHL